MWSPLETVVGNRLKGRFYRNLAFYWDLEFDEEIYCLDCQTIVLQSFAIGV